MSRYYRMSRHDYSITPDTGFSAGYGDGAIVVHSTGEVIVTKEVLDAMRVHVDYADLIGVVVRKNLYRVGPDTLTEAERVANYPRRSDRERAVAERGAAILAFIREQKGVKVEAN